MGALAPGSAHARPSAQAPINTSRKCLGGGAKRLKISGDSKHFSFFPKNKIKFPIAPMWALAPGSAHARPSIDITRNWWAQVPINLKLHAQF